MKHLSRDEWMKKDPPIYWLDIQEDLQDVKKQIIIKWLENNCKDWFHVSHKTYVFGSNTDRTVFKTWYLSSMFDDFGEVTNK